MKKDTKLFLVIDNSMDQGDPMSKKQKSDRVAPNSSATGTQGMQRRTTSQSFEETSRLYPGRFIDGNTELASKGLSAFILPGMRIKPSQSEEAQDNVATKEDWEEFDRNEMILDRIVQDHIIQNEKEEQSQVKGTNENITKTPAKPQERTSLPFAEISKRYPGRFIDGNAELESKGISAFIIPGMGMKPEPPEEPIENEATAEDWADFERGEEALNEMAKRHMIQNEKEKQPQTEDPTETRLTVTLTVIGPDGKMSLEEFVKAHPGETFKIIRPEKLK